MSVLLKRYYAYFVIQNRERLQFYPKSPDMQTLILVIEAHFSDCWEPRSQIQGQGRVGRGGEGNEEMKKWLLVLISFCSKCPATGQQGHQQMFALEPTRRCCVINGFPYLKSNQGAKRDRPEGGKELCLLPLQEG